jgi:hypothetical protein
MEKEFEQPLPELTPEQRRIAELEQTVLRLDEELRLRFGWTDQSPTVSELRTQAKIENLAEIERQKALPDDNIGQHPHGRYDSPDEHCGRPEYRGFNDFLRDLDRYLAATPEHCAEHQIVQKMRDQIDAGAIEINLTQRYSTDSWMQAQQRHDDAIRNITSFIANLREFEFTVDTGFALTAQRAQKEEISESYGMSV